MTDLSIEQKAAIALVKSGKNLFLTGGAGVGKSFTLKEIIKCTQGALICAPTGVAAQNIGGATLHSTFKIPVPLDTKKLKEDYVRNVLKRNEKIKKVLLGAHTLVIDEISMCRSDVFDYVCNTLSVLRDEYNHEYQVILCGDFCQLPPVVTDKDEKYMEFHYPNNTEGFAFKTENWNKLNLSTIVLQKVFRQDNSAFSEALNKIRFGDTDGLDYVINNSSKKEDLTAINICTKNKVADNINNSEVNKLPGKCTIFNVEKTGKVESKDLRCLEILKLKEGARVIFIANINEEGCSAYNGEIGTVNKLDINSVIVETANGLQRVSRFEWQIQEYVFNEEEQQVELHEVGSYSQIPLKPAYAITVHKSQGMTYESGNIRAGIEDFFTTGQLYVALSRVKSIDKLFVSLELTPDNLKKLCLNDPDVVEFYKNINSKRIPRLTSV